MQSTATIRMIHHNEEEYWDLAWMVRSGDRRHRTMDLQILPVKARFHG